MVITISTYIAEGKKRKIPYRSKLGKEVQRE